MLTREERMKLHNVREDYLELFYTRAELRDEKPDLWQSIVDQWEAVKLRLEDDEWEKIKSTCTHEISEDGKLREIVERIGDD